MENIKIALTEKRKTECNISIFPKDYYDIPELSSFQDISVVRNHVYKVLEPYAGKQVDIILNGGMLIEILCVIQVATKLNISLCVLHCDKEEDTYVSQAITWCSVLDKILKERGSQDSYEITKDTNTMDSNIEKFIFKKKNESGKYRY